MSAVSWIVDKGILCATRFLISPYTHEKQQIALKSNLNKRKWYNYAQEIELSVN